MNYLEKYQNMSRPELLKTTILDQVKHCPAALSEVSEWNVNYLGCDLYRLSFKGTGYGLTVFDHHLRDHLADRDFNVAEMGGDCDDTLIDIDLPLEKMWLKPKDGVYEGLWIIKDVKSEYSYEALLDMPVESVGTPYHGVTLRRLIKVYGTGESELYNPEDFRRFARCPPIKGLIGPMMPNSGYVARYEPSEVYDMLTR